MVNKIHNFLCHALYVCIDILTVDGDDFASVLFISYSLILALKVCPHRSDLLCPNSEDHLYVPELKKSLLIYPPTTSTIWILRLA